MHNCNHDEDIGVTCEFFNTTTVTAPSLTTAGTTQGPTTRFTTQPLNTTMPPNSNWTLFAVITNTACAERLPYSPDQLMSEVLPMFSTFNKESTSQRWRQVVMPNFYPSVADFEIIWEFTTGKSLRQRFQDATSGGEAVKWTIRTTGGTFTRSGIWWFSNSASLRPDSHKWMRSSGSGFSSDDGAWGAASGTVNGNS